MNLISTRDPDQKPVPYSKAIVQGLAADGGLFVPIALPSLDKTILQDLVDKPYLDIFTTVRGLFVDDIDPAQQMDLAHRAYALEKFPDAQDGNLVPVTEISPDFFIQNLSLGPTAAFKDMAMQPLAQDLNYVLQKQAKRLRLLGATSGDTGSAAEAAMKGLETVKLFMLSPEQGMTIFQKAQMAELSGDNIFNLSVRGTFDDCQDLVKQIKREPEFADLGAVNSINWGRIVSQVPYYVAAYLQVAGNRLGQPVDFVIPTGNFGNMLAGYLAREIGVPIRRLVAATNENDVVHRLIQTGEYRQKTVQITSSPSMDISKASNYERLAYYLLGQKPKRVREYIKRFETTGKVSFEEMGLSSDILKQLNFDSGSSTHQDRLLTIQWAYKTAQYIIDPHTAAAVHVARQKQEAGVPIVCLSTALPVKFEPAIREALGFVPEREARFRDLEKHAQTGFSVIPNDREALKNFIREHS